MIRHERTSATFISFTGNLDTRVELDKNIVECGDKDRFNSLLSIMAAKASYENHAYLQYTVTDIWKVPFYIFLYPFKMISFFFITNYVIFKSLQMELLGSYDFWNDK